MEVPTSEDLQGERKIDSEIKMNIVHHMQEAMLQMLKQTPWQNKKSLQSLRKRFRRKYRKIHTQRKKYTRRKACKETTHSNLIHQKNQMEQIVYQENMQDTPRNHI